jgi:hypothetical protein
VRTAWSIPRRTRATRRARRRAGPNTNAPTIRGIFSWSPASLIIPAGAGGHGVAERERASRREFPRRLRVPAGHQRPRESDGPPRRTIASPRSSAPSTGRRASRVGLGTSIRASSSATRSETSLRTSSTPRSGRSPPPPTARTSTHPPSCSSTGSSFSSTAHSGCGSASWIRTTTSISVASPTTTGTLTTRSSPPSPLRTTPAVAWGSTCSGTPRPSGRSPPGSATSRDARPSAGSTRSSAMAISSTDSTSPTRPRSRDSARATTASASSTATMSRGRTDRRT